MNGGTLSGGVVIALAAALWLAYLVPTWLRRRDYLNAERNAVRLQQTLRILAETAEAPEEVHVEATAREVARQQRLLKKVQGKADAAARAHAASEARAAARFAAMEEAQPDDGPTFPSVSPSRQRAADAVGEPDASPDETRAIDDLGAEPAEPERTHRRTEGSRSYDAQRPTPTRTNAQPAAPRITHSGISAAARAEHDRAFAHAVRRTRLMTTGVVLASLVGIGFGVYSLATAGSWWVLAASAALLVCAVAVLRRLAQQVAAHNAARRTRVEVVRQNPELYDHALHAEPETVEDEPVDVSWQPQPLPKPMYQSPGSRAAAAMASVDAAVALRRAAARAELEQRAARIAAAQVPTIQPQKERPVEQPAAPAVSSGAQVASDPPTPPKPPSRYARMGMVDDVQSEHIDLDEALRRRRAAG
ncbi:hypothetical protein HII28_06520 [Planctomonas sp. JC2975]|uniref:hypothetical protein n=1 Tax=Planctomonas sp. JC2975 TaxID=2729626 RepID=UPI0014733FF4|nr:hypothetical protein [Planctomonas sp. JC2975]NNC11532.1 hypothetical protein [Planctomonas sp. JC2975]